MARLEAEGDWDAFVNQAVDDLLDELDGAAVARERLLKRWDALRGEETRKSPVRELLISHSMRLLAAAGAGTGPLRCDDGHSTVDCEFILRPNGTPYYRCVGHAPPDCYDVDYRSIGCP